MMSPDLCNVFDLPYYKRNRGTIDRVDAIDVVDAVEAIDVVEAEWWHHTDIEHLVVGEIEANGRGRDTFFIVGLAHVHGVLDGYADEQLKCDGAMLYLTMPQKLDQCAHARRSLYCTNDRAPHEHTRLGPHVRPQPCPRTRQLSFLFFILMFILAPRHVLCANSDCLSPRLGTPRHLSAHGGGEIADRPDAHRF